MHSASNNPQVINILCLGGKWMKMILNLWVGEGKFVAAGYGSFSNARS